MHALSCRADLEVLNSEIDKITPGPREMAPKHSRLSLPYEKDRVVNGTDTPHHFQFYSVTSFPVAPETTQPFYSVLS